MSKIAEEMAKKQREISVSEFFTKNRHLLGFDNPRKALLTSVKEAVDNSLDACEEANILPDIKVLIKPAGDERFVVVVQDNGPGIVKQQVPKIFGKLLYGSKFHKLSQSRGQQGIGVSAAAMYGQLTTGKSTKIVSKIKGRKEAHYYEIQLNTKTNEPEIVKEDEVDCNFEHGVKVEIELEAKYQKGKQSVDEYLKQTAIANPHVSVSYVNPENQQIEFPRATKEMPRECKEIKPHPYGVELGVLMKMLRDTKSRTLQSFLMKDFSRVSSKVAKEICEKAGLYVNSRPSRIAVKEADALFNSIKKVKIMAPPTNCLSPIGEELLTKGLKKEVNAEFYAAVTRPPSVYRGNPFQIEVAIAYGGSVEGDLVRVLRFANRVPLQYQPGACAITKSVVDTSWRNYGLSQSKGALPSGSVMLVVHIASVWVPFTSESKEAIANYPEIIKEVKLALQEVGRKLAGYIRKTVKAKEFAERVNLFENYIPELASSLSRLTKEDKNKLMTNLYKTLKKGVPELNNGKEK